MPLIKPICRRLIAACVLLLLICGSGCKKYRTQPIEFDNWGFHKDQYDMMSTDAYVVSYPIVNEDAPVTISDVQIKCNEPSISITYSQKDSDDARQVRVVYKTNNTPQGTYPMRITFVDKNGSFIERVTTINVVSFIDLISDSITNYHVLDTVRYAPFRADGSGYNNDYFVTIRHKAGTPPNRFRFTALGHYKNIGAFPDVFIDLDTATGEIVAPPQFAYYATIEGHGRIEKSDGSHRMRGYFIYTYRDSWGDEYEGHLSF